MNREFKLRINIPRKSKKATEDGFNGYGKIRKNQNTPYGYFSKFSKISGIYCIKSLVNNKLYIGSTKDIQLRVIKHFSLLKRQKHPNNNLQKDYNIYGFDNFEVSILEETTNLLEREKYHQLLYKEEEIYNLSISGVRHSKAQIDGWINQNRSNHQTEEYRKKMSKLKENHIGKFDKFTGKLLEVFNNSNEACKNCGLAKSTLLGCCNGSKKSGAGYIWHYLDDDNNIIAQGKGKNRTIIVSNEDIV